MTRILIFLALAALIFWAWRSASAPRPQMTRAAAARLLGVAEDADAAAIAEAHKRLIAKVHPDAGGSEDLAAQVNLARDILLQTPAP
ncbi:MAG: hypothetical protein RJB22_996 [Pseudomonadota bacterium]|jgi:ABC-type molybdate transport system substrate-binding protein